MNLLLRKTEKIPLSKLPYGFQKRLIALAPLRILNELGRVCSDVRMFRLFCPTAFDKVLITDNNEVYQEASKDDFLNRFCKFMCHLWFFKVMTEFHGDVVGEYDVVLHVDEIFERKLHIYVADTLVLNCSTSAYKKLLPFITGSFTRLILNGHITWQQVKWIMRPDVKKICINGLIQIPLEFYGDFADFLVKQVSDNDFSVALYQNENLETALQEACKRQNRLMLNHDEPTHLQITTNFYELVYFPKLLCATCLFSIIVTSIIATPLYLIGVDLGPPR